MLLNHLMSRLDPFQRTINIRDGYHRDTSKEIAWSPERYLALFMDYTREAVTAFPIKTWWSLISSSSPDRRSLTRMFWSQIAEVKEPRPNPLVQNLLLYHCFVGSRPLNIIYQRSFCPLRIILSRYLQVQFKRANSATNFLSVQPNDIRVSVYSHFIPLSASLANKKWR